MCLQIVVYNWSNCHIYQWGHTYDIAVLLAWKHFADLRFSEAESYFRWDIHNNVKDTQDGIIRIRHHILPIRN